MDEKKAVQMEPLKVEHLAASKDGNSVDQMEPWLVESMVDQTDASMESLLGRKMVSGKVA